MNFRQQSPIPLETRRAAVRVALMLGFVLFLPLSAHASPFDTGITNVQTLFTGTIAKAVSLIAVVLGGLGFAFGEPGAKKGLAFSSPHPRESWESPIGTSQPSKASTASTSPSELKVRDFVTSPSTPDR